MGDTAVYERRFITFVDILGFQEHISRSECDSAYSVNILEALQLIKDVEDAESEPEEGFDDGTRVTAFSDNIVISHPVGRTGGFYSILLEIVHLQLELLAKGFVMRG